MLFDCLWYRRQATKVADGGEGGGGPVAAEGEELEPPADGGGAAPANEEPVAAPAPAAAQTTPSTNVNRVNLEDSWTLQEHVDTGQGQRNSG